MARVVVIDDEQLVAEACATVLRAAAHEVSVAHDGESGLRLIRELLPDVVISDIRMPGIDGHQLVATLKAHSATTHIPVLLMSGHCYLDKKSCDAFLAKPFLVSELLATVQCLVLRRAEK
ncbi:MAG TPA: response regulator [Methylomirabilota bacterium]|nr:response regulator [Methylomirabilota bacterium]